MKKTLSRNSERWMPSAPRLTSTVMKITVVFAMVTFTLTELVNNGLNVSAAVEDSFMKRALKMENINSSPVAPAFNISYLLSVHNILLI
jgi:hypothetical protein